MKPCVFCKLQECVKNTMFSTTHFFGVWDIDPIQAGHLLIISKNHYMNLSEIPSSELSELFEIQKNVVGMYEKEPSVYGVTVFYNNGKAMDNGVHFHVHVVPRYKEDGFWNHQHVTNQPMDCNALERKMEKLFR